MDNRIVHNNGYNLRLVKGYKTYQNMGIIDYIVHIWYDMLRIIWGAILTEVNVKYDIPEDRLKEAVDGHKDKVPLRTRFRNKVISFKQWLHRNVRKFMIITALIFMGLLIIILPNPSYSIAFDIVFSILLFIVFNYLIPMVVLQMINFETNQTLIIKLSYHRLHDFQIVDCDHKPSAFVYWLYAGKDRVLIVDDIDLTNDIITLNAICCKLSFVKSFKDALCDMQNKLQITQNSYEKLKLYRSYEAMVKAGELNDMNPLNQIFTRQKVKINGEILSTDSIDDNDKNNIGTVN